MKQNKKALITGASSGIGAAFARRLATEGYNLILVARRQHRLVELAAELNAQVNTEIIVADLSKPIDIERVEKRILGLKSLDMLINNAGFVTGGQFIQKEIDTVTRMLNLHVLAGVRLSRAALPRMVAQGEGAIINVSSISAFNPVATNETYGATKAYLLFFSECLQDELEGTGIHVQALCPGYTFTKATQPLDRSQLPRIVSWMSPEEVVNKSLNALGNKQVVYIPGYRNRLIATLYWMRARIKNLRVYLLSGSEKKVKITVLMVMAGGFLTFF